MILHVTLGTKVVLNNYINKYTMKIINYKNTTQKNLQKYIERSGDRYKDVVPIVEEIIEEVQKCGDSALLQYTEKFDNVLLENLEVTNNEILKAYKSASNNLINALELAVENQYKFQSSLYESKTNAVETMPGIEVWTESRPIEKVGLYVPGGRARYPSSIVMVGVPALIAGCRELVICTPPDSDGFVPNSTLVAIEVLNRFFESKTNASSIKVFKVGGAQAIAAMAYGTKTIPKVYKIFGAGNTFVTAAKMSVFGEVDIDMPAGPSEVMILADESVSPQWIAADLISQCEHGEESAAILVTNSKSYAKEVQKSAFELAETLSTKETIIKALNNYGVAVVVENWDQAIEIANTYAPEHLEITMENYMEIKDRIINAGSVFLGKYSSEPAGDYATGSNHVLPTNGFAKAFEGLSVNSFLKKIEFQTVSKSGLESILDAVNILASEEGLPAHANALNIRFKK